MCQKEKGYIIELIVDELEVKLLTLELAHYQCIKHRA